LRKLGESRPQILQVGSLQMDIGRHEVTLNNQAINLTASEFDLLRVLMEQAGYVFTRSELIHKGLGADYEGLDRTLDSHIRNLRQKLEPNPKQPTFIQTVHGVGYRLVGDRDE
ncbi:MAG: response regulator transcription factor, partial [Chloroflexi bacterium]|nr:response regulator transcription factor [Chloroflexota bacterium]